MNKSAITVPDEVIQRLANSISWLRDGSVKGPGVGLGDFLTLYETLANKQPVDAPANNQTVENLDSATRILIDTVPNSQVASELIDVVLQEYGDPLNSKAAARAGFEAARRLVILEKQKVEGKDAAVWPKEALDFIESASTTMAAKMKPRPLMSDDTYNEVSHYVSLTSPTPCRADGGCQYAIDSAVSDLGHCPEGACIMKNLPSEG